MARFSKVAPATVAPVTLNVTEPASLITSSPWAGVLYSTSVLPASMVTVSPFDSVTVSGRSSAWLTFTVKDGC
ncbi:hypothetical protein D3C80_1045580 [compost metagenome]